MAEALINIEVEKEDVVAVLDRMRSIFQPVTLQEFLRVGPTKTLQARAQARFDAEGDQASGKWAPLRFSTVAIRDRAGFPGANPINKRTGELESFMTSSTGVTMSDGDGAILVWPSSPGGELFEKLNTAQRGKPKQANFGATVPRPVVAVDETDAALILEDLMQWFTTEMARGNAHAL